MVLNDHEHSRAKSIYGKTQTKNPNLVVDLVVVVVVCTQNTYNASVKYIYGYEMI